MEAQNTMPRKKKTEVEQPTIEELGEVVGKLESMAEKLDDSRFIPLDSDESNQAIELFQALRVSNQLKSDMKKINNPTREEIKMLVNLYYQIQDSRKALREQIRSIESDESKKANVIVLDWCLKNFAIIEAGVNEFMKTICEQNEVGRWLLSITGIGPVLAAGCLAYFNIEGKNYASQFISYAGLNDINRPFIGRKGSEKIMEEISKGKKTITDEMVAEFAAKTHWSYEYLRNNAYDPEKSKWSKTKLVAAAAKIPYNADLKCFMWKVGKSFNWLCNNEKSLYGRLFSERRIIETRKNEEGCYAEQAAQILASKNIGKNTEAYKAYIQGKLPKAHINARCLRWVEKIFISHLFEEMYRVHYDKVPPRYYNIAKDPIHNKEINPEVPFHKVPEEIQ